MPLGLRVFLYLMTIQGIEVALKTRTQAVSGKRGICHAKALQVHVFLSPVGFISKLVPCKGISLLKEPRSPRFKS